MPHEVAPLQEPSPREVPAVREPAGVRRETPPSPCAEREQAGTWQVPVVRPTGFEPPPARALAADVRTRRTRRIAWQALQRRPLVKRAATAMPLTQLKLA